MTGVPISLSLVVWPNSTIVCYFGGSLLFPPKQVRYLLPAYLVFHVGMKNLRVPHVLSVLLPSTSTDISVNLVKQSIHAQYKVKETA